MDEFTKEEAKELHDYIRTKAGYGNVLAYTILIRRSYDCIMQGMTFEQVKNEINRLIEPIV